jgi:fucose permease
LIGTSSSVFNIIKCILLAMASGTVTPLLSPDEDGDHRDTLHRPVPDDDSPRDVHETQSLLSPPDDTRGLVDDGNSVIKVAAAMFSFVVLGLYTSSIGVILPHLETHYGLSDGQVSFTFLAWPIGYVLAAQLNDVLHSRFGQRGIAIIGPLTHVIFALGASAHPPFILFLVFIAVGAFGAGLLDGSWCAWAGAMERASLVSGFLHGSFSVGAATGPLLADALIVPGKRPWYTWYYVLVCANFFIEKNRNKFY